ncbi:hypothetical protein [Actinomadura sp. HBU206391]|uniref:hypothetical protein n=1 Tax=Actinomadura sp. HBU206391 TaxID=2731692 RepID=UPI00164FA271|nr:hypothetical protein [Actinomadura sp. HBU206391]MBC6459182.1 hypothetical protein [Actinomadura sp. HBU206391]
MSESAASAEDVGSGDGAGLLGVVFSYVQVALLGGLVAFTALWTVEVIAPTTPENVVISQHGCSYDTCCDGHSTIGTCAFAADGQALDIADYNHIGLVVPGYDGDPVVVHRSTVTGRVLKVWSTKESADLRVAGGICTLVLYCLAAGLLLLLTLPVRARLGGERPRRRPVTVLAVLVLTAVPTGAWALRGPEIADARPLPDSMGEYSQAGFLPDKTRRIGQTVETEDGIAIQVTGPPTTRPPTGLPGRLNDFDLMIVPVTTRLTGDAIRPDDYGQYRVTLIGAGRGNTVIVPDPPCATALRTFRGEVRAGTPPIRGRLCFAVPPGFRPRYLVIETSTESETGETKYDDDIAISLGTG